MPNMVFSQTFTVVLSFAMFIYIISNFFVRSINKRLKLPMGLL